MRALSKIYLLLCCSVPLFAVEIVIKDETKPSEEEQKVELPAPPSLTINVVNTSNFDMTVAVKASELDSQVNVIVVQNTVAKSSNLTLGKYFSQRADATFKLQEYSIIFTFGEFPSQKLECSLPVAQDAMPSTTDEQPRPDIKKSIDIYLYTPADMLWPKCIVYFDT